MTNDFDAFVGDDNANTPSRQLEESSSNQPESEGGPLWLLAVIGIALVVALICFPPATKPLHVAGYVVGAIVVGVTAIAYRSIEKRRSISPTFVAKVWPGRTVAAGLLLGIVIAAVHAFYLAERVTVRR